MPPRSSLPAPGLDSLYGILSILLAGGTAITSLSTLKPSKMRIIIATHQDTVLRRYISPSHFASHYKTRKYRGKTFMHGNTMIMRRAYHSGKSLLRPLLLRQTHSLDEVTEVLADYWEITGSFITRVHKCPRRDMCAPDRCVDAPPVPLSELDVQRVTITDLSSTNEKHIEDCWDGTENNVRQLSQLWTGSTRFYRFYGDPPAGYYYVQGRLTRRQKGTRPDNVHPDIWP